MTEKNWIEIKYGPFAEQPVYYWFESVEKKEEEELMKLLGDLFGPPQIRSPNHIMQSEEK